MNTEAHPRKMVQDPNGSPAHPGYMPGFGNDFETEALPDALPQGNEQSAEVQLWPLW